jgi:hypothetical protein
MDLIKHTRFDATYIEKSQIASYNCNAMLRACERERLATWFHCRVYVSVMLPSCMVNQIPTINMAAAYEPNQPTSRMNTVDLTSAKNRFIAAMVFGNCTSAVPIISTLHPFLPLRRLDVLAS